MHQLEIIKTYEYGSLVAYKMKDVFSVNTTLFDFYVSITNLSETIVMPVDKLINYVSYNQTLQTGVAYYRDKNFQVVKIFKVDLIPLLLRDMALASIITRDEVEAVKTKIDELMKVVDKADGNHSTAGFQATPMTIRTRGV